MEQATPELLALTDNSNEPYRVVLRQLRCKLRKTIDYLNERLEGRHPDIDTRDIVWRQADLQEPLELLYHSLCDSGMKLIANGLLLDI